MLTRAQVLDELERSPVIAATDRTGWRKAVSSEVEVLFHLNTGIFTVKKEIELAKENGKRVFIHIDLAEGIGKDTEGLRFLRRAGADGIISTRASLIKAAREEELLAVQRFFALDSKGISSIRDMIAQSHPDFVEIMPGVIPKVIKVFAASTVPIIAGGLIEEKSEVTAALSHGATAISTGKAELWSI